MVQKKIKEGRDGKERVVSKGGKENEQWRRKGMKRRCRRNIRSRWNFDKNGRDEKERVRKKGKGIKRKRGEGKEEMKR